MGAWGLGSDENDWTYDTVGLDVFARLEGITLTEQGRSASNGFVKDLVDNSSEGEKVLNNVGVAIFLLKLGCIVPVKNLHLVRMKLVHENHAVAYPAKVKERKSVVEKEIEMIDTAMNNGGCVPGPPEGVRGIAHAQEEEGKK